MIVRLEITRLSSSQPPHVRWFAITAVGLFLAWWFDGLMVARHFIAAPILGDTALHGSLAFLAMTLHSMDPTGGLLSQFQNLMPQLKRAKESESQ